MSYKYKGFFILIFLFFIGPLSHTSLFAQDEDMEEDIDYSDLLESSPVEAEDEDYSADASLESTYAYLASLQENVERVSGVPESPITEDKFVPVPNSIKKDKSALTEALFSAIRAGSLSETIDVLIAGADVNSRNDLGLTPVMEAIISKQPNIAYYLLVRGADVNATTSEGNSILSLAVMSGDLQAVRLLMEEVDKKRRPQINIYNTNGQGLLDLAIANKRYVVLEYLLQKKYFDINQTGKIGMTPLGLAALMGDVRAANTLFKYRAKPDARLNWDERTPLMIAAAIGNVNMLNVLLGGGADIHKTDKDGKHALAIAAEAGQAQSALFLLPKTNRFDSRDKKGKTTLVYALLSGLDQLAAALMTKGADVNIKNLAGQTPLMIAASRGNLELVRFIIEKTDADKFAVLSDKMSEKLPNGTLVNYKKGWNVLDIAEAAGQYPIASYLVFQQKLRFNKKV